jgi:hypothetical protein
MKLALLVAANPRKVKEGPECQLPAGEWKIVTDNVADSLLAVSYINGRGLTTIELENSGTIIYTDHPILIHAAIQSPGNEDFVSVFAERVK